LAVRHIRSSLTGPIRLRTTGLLCRRFGTVMAENRTERTKGGCTLPRPRDPVSIPHDVENRGVATGIDGELIAQVSSSLFPPPPQVTGSARLNLSRWRHGFKSRWDYAGKRPCSGSRWCVALHWPRGVHEASRLGGRRRPPSVTPSTASSLAAGLGVHQPGSLTPAS
jgi:hypothetical protein